MRQGRFRAGDYSEGAERYHLYVQFLAQEQMEALAARHRGGLYLDLPLGVHGGGYDVWRHRDQFLEGVSAGAPPDTFFTRGQNWGFPPAHPARTRERGHEYFRSVMRHHLRVAGALRIDHMMGFHRLYCIPHGFDAGDGVYVRYPAEELYGIAVLESHRHSSVLVGEDLGTVPHEVRRAMARHGIHRTYVVQYEADPDGRTVATPPSRSVASLNTHDMPTFNAFWRALDVRDRTDLGLLDREGARGEREVRARLRTSLVEALRRGGWLRTEGPRTMHVVEALLAALADGPAWMVLVNLEDLWGESSPQNVPGTSTERPNWRRKLRYSLEELMHNAKVKRTLESIADNRRKV
jgi:4-alpha-glucanotransferase